MKNICSSLKWILILSVVTSFTILACNKDNDDDGHSEGDTTAPVLTLSSPTDGQDLADGETIHIMGMATDEKALHQYTWSIKDAAGDTVHEGTESIHDQTEAEIHHMHVISGVTQATTWTVTVLVEDHGENSDEKSVTVNVNP